MGRPKKEENKQEAEVQAPKVDTVVTSDSISDVVAETASDENIDIEATSDVNEDNLNVISEDTNENSPEHLEVKEATFIVKKSFKDAPQYRINGVANTYEEGEDVSDFDSKRLAELEKRGLVVKQ